MPNADDSNSSLQKAGALAQKMNALTDKLKANLGLSEDMAVTADEMLEYVQDDVSYIDNQDCAEVINVKNMIDDFQLVRSTLKESADNARRVLDAVALYTVNRVGEATQMGKADVDMVTAVAALNTSLTESMKAYIVAYKDLSNAVLNLKKLQGNNDVQVQVTETVINTADLIKSLGAV